MAKAKKQKLSLEELLEQALVKEEDRPYEVPQNWVWTNFLLCLDTLESGKRPKGGVNGISDGVPSLGGEHLSYDGRFNFEKIKYVPMSFAEEMSKGIVENEDILIVKDGATTGKASYVDNSFPFKFAVINEHIFKCKVNKKLVSKFFFWYIVSPIGQKFIDDNIKGSAQGGINTTFAENLNCPITPLAEQQRIVAVIESLFEKLDTAKELAQNALDSFENRKAAILHKAFTGELTTKWREENGVSLDEWKKKLLGELIKSGPQNGLYKPKTEYGQGCMIVRIDNFYDGVINPWHTLKRLSLEESEKEIYGLRNNDIIINRVNSIQYLGKSALVKDLDDICVFESNVMRMSLLENAVPEYIIRYLNSSQGLKELRKNAKHAVNQASINQTDVKNAIISLPSIEEQNEIVCILDNLLENEQRAKELCDIIEKIDLMKKAILARAFRGELGTNDPEEESAVELLKEVLKEKI